MLFAVAGVTGNTGKVVADTLLSQGHAVRVIVRDAAKAEAFVARGATVAVTASKVTHVVLLSSVGAHLPSGSGPIAALYPVEHALSTLPDTGVSLLRAGYFMENLPGNFGMLDKGLLVAFHSGSLAIPMVATRDIGATAAALLVEGPPAPGSARIVELSGADITFEDVAGVDEAQRAQLGPGGAVVGDLGGVVPAVQGHGRVETRSAGAPVGRGGLASGDLVGEDELEELGVAHLVGGGECEPFGEGVEAAAELDPA